MLLHAIKPAKVTATNVIYMDQVRKWKWPLKMARNPGYLSVTKRNEIG